VARREAAAAVAAQARADGPLRLRADVRVAAADDDQQRLRREVALLGLAQLLGLLGDAVLLKLLLLLLVLLLSVVSSMSSRLVCSYRGNQNV
jgi:hypothetical protein